MRKGAKSHHISACPVARVAEIVGDTWVLLIIRDLTQKPRRFSDLATSLKGISTRTLTAKLKKLEENGLIERTAHKEWPPRVDYTLSPRGKELHTIIDDMRKYGERFLAA